MNGGQMKTPARGQAQPGQDSRLATAVGTQNLAQNEFNRHWLARLWASMQTLAARVAS
jgi:hypothetical protein